MWTPRSLDDGKPFYLALADALQDDVARGRLRPGTRLPPQRSLAKRLGVDFTTISRAYAEAGRRGLVAAHVGRGTFVRRIETDPGIAPRFGPDGSVDLSLNLPPEAVIEAGGAALATTLDEIRGDAGLATLLRYQQNAGRDDHRAVAAAWVAERYGAPVAPERIVLCGGAQHAITALLSTLTGDGDAVATEVLTYQGFKAIADLFHRPIIGLPIDDGGIDVRGFEKACRTQGVRAVYCTPTLHNPTGSVMNMTRRRAIARIARDYGVALIEDDVYGPLMADAPASLSSFAPELGFYIASVSKVVSPGLRLAFVVTPSERDAARIAATVRATAWMATPLTAEIATHWIRAGTAERIIGLARGEVARRQKVARAILRKAELPVRGDPRALHLWLELPAPWTAADFVRAAQRAGVLVMPAEAFAVSTYAGPPAVRLSLTGAPSLEALTTALGRVASLARSVPGHPIAL